MKRIIPMILSLFMFITAGSPQEAMVSIETMVPDTAILYVKTPKIRGLLASINYIVYTILTGENREKVRLELTKIKDMGGVDVLNTDSLTKTGIDIDKAAAFAYFTNDASGNDRMAMLVPVLNEKTFPLKFVEIVKKSLKNDGIDIFPAITDYKSRTVYQIQKDIFFTSFDGYFVVTSSGELLKNIIDTRQSGMKSLAGDSSYTDYLTKYKSEHDVKFFMKKEFLAEAIDYINKKIKKPSVEDGETGSSAPADNLKNLCSMKIQDIMEKKGTMADDIFSSVEYAALGASVKQNMLKLDITSNFTRGNNTVSSLIDCFRPGTAGEALYSLDTGAYFFLGLDVSRIDSLCRGPGFFCADYNGFKGKIKKEMGIDIPKDVAPNFRGFVNVMIGSDTDPYLNTAYSIFIPMNNSADSKSLWTKLTSYLAKTYGKENGFKESTAGDARLCWYIDDKDKQTFIGADERGFYFSNNADHLAITMKTKTAKEIKVKNELLKKMGEQTFFSAHIKKNSFLRTIFMLMGNPASNEIFRQVGDVYLSGDRIDNYISISLDIEVLKQ